MSECIAPCMDVWMNGWVGGQVTDNNASSKCSAHLSILIMASKH